MIRKNLIKATVITTIIATILAASGCGKKAANNDETTMQAVTVSAETSSNAAKELIKTGLITFEYTDPDGNTYTLEGKAVASETGEAVIEVTDAEGNKVTFTGKAKTVDGKLSVSDIAVKDAGTLVKADGNKIEVTTGAIVADASESTEGESNSDIAASDDIKQEVETAKKEESVIEAAREEVTKSESNVAANDNVTPEEPKQETPVTPAEPDTTPEEPKQDTPVTPSEPEPEKPAATHMETKYIYYHNIDGSLYYTDSVTYLAYEDGTPVEKTIYDGETGPDSFPDYDNTDILIMCWLVNSGGAALANNEQMFGYNLDISEYTNDIDMYPGYLKTK